MDGDTPEEWEDAFANRIGLDRIGLRDEDSMLGLADTRSL